MNRGGSARGGFRVETAILAALAGNQPFRPSGKKKRLPVHCRGSGIFSVARLACLDLYRLDKHPLMSKGKTGFVLLSRSSKVAAADLASLACRGS